MSLAPGLDSDQATDPEGVNDNAAALLRKRGITVTEITRVCSDSILYLGSYRRPMTAWLAFNGQRLEVACESGFLAEPSAAVRQRLDWGPSLSREAPQDDLDAADKA